MRRSACLLVVISVALSLTALGGCKSGSQRAAELADRSSASGAAASAVARGGPKVQGANLNDPVRPLASDQPIVFGAAGNEWASFAIQVSALPKATRKTSYSLRLQSPLIEGKNETIALENFSAAQVLPMPVDVNRAGYVRHTGLMVSNRPLPRALLPVAMPGGIVNLSAVRDPADPTNPQSRRNGPGGEPLLFWFDLHVPPETRPGDYIARCDLVASDTGKAIDSIPLKITVYDFVVPDDRHLLMTSRLEWSDLKRLYPEQFETVTPRLLNRNDDRYAAALRTLDAIVKLAQLHRTQVVIPRLQPVVKWPTGEKPNVDWQDLDTVLAPWLNGDAFADHVPFGYWPLPAVDFLERYDRKSQLDYWSNAATHFDQNDWLPRTPVAIESTSSGRAGATESIQLSADAAQVLSVHPHVRVTLPLEDDQIQFANSGNAKLIDPKSTTRILSAGPGIVFASPIQRWPDNLKPPLHWLRTDVPGLVPYVGAGGDERDVRVWSWLAFHRQAGLILWGSPLPRTDLPIQSADPNDLVWFYPGIWFGVDEPVPTIQLKWLRRAQQDFEYLWLAKQRGEMINATLMARLISKPVQIQPNQPPDPTYALMCGTADPKAWSDGQRLLARTILLQEPGQSAEKAAKNELDLQTLQWCAPQESPMLMGRTVRWEFDPLAGAQWVNLTVGSDLYNPSDKPTPQSLLEWNTVPVGWQVQPQPLPVQSLQPYQVARYEMNARYNLAAIDNAARIPAAVTFINGFNQRETTMKFSLPVAASERLGPRRNPLDGKLQDWDPADAIQNNAPLVRMFNRPALQRQELQFAENPSTIYTGWGDENFYVAFKLSGVQTTQVTTTRNFVDYQFRRAWGEDLCEMLIQPVFNDNSLGPVLHVVCKPAGQWVERKLDPRLYADPWQPFEGTGIRYSGALGGGNWSGEVAIPWKAIMDQARGVPRLLRFNFVQHIHNTGESASWAGPIDFGRDDSFMGLLYLREADNPGMAGP